MKFCPTRRQRERAFAIANDIAEGMDNGESRDELRLALAVFADELQLIHRREADKRLVRLEESVAKLSQLLDRPRN
jgi:hypothetical protein